MKIHSLGARPFHLGRQAWQS